MEFHNPRREARREERGKAVTSLVFIAFFKSPRMIKTEKEAFLDVLHSRLILKLLIIKF